MKTTIFLLALFSLLAQADHIEEIRTLYSEAIGEIEKGNYYRTTTIINSDDASYPAVGIYFQNIDFFWEIDIEFNFEPSIRFVRINSQHSAIEEYHEFLYYDTGALAFVYRKAGIMQEVERFYFNQNGELIIYIRGEEIIDSPNIEFIDLAGEVAYRGACLAESFSLTH